MSAKKPPDAELTMTDAPPVVPKGPPPADERTVIGFDGTQTVDGLPGTSNPTLPALVPSSTLDAPPEVPRGKVPAATVHGPHDTLDDPYSRADAVPSSGALAQVSDVEPLLTPSNKVPPPGGSLDALAPLPRMVLDKRVVAGIPIVLAAGLTWWAFSTPDSQAPEPIFVPAAPLTPTRIEPPAPDIEPGGLFVDVAVGGGKTERRPAGKVKLLSTPAANVSTVKGAKLGKTPTEITAEVGPLDLLFENHELGLTKSVTINVRPGTGGKETIEFGRGWLDIDAPSGTKISVDGKSLGTAPVQQQTLYEGRHTVSAVFADGKKKARQISVVAGETVSHLITAP